MILVNYLGRFQAMSETFRHHRVGFSFADTVAPYFLFMVGIGFRLSYVKRRENDGPGAARRAALWRYLLLIAVGIYVYGPDFRMDVWDALTDIGLAGLLALPVIGLGLGPRLAAAVLYLALFQVLSDFTPYGVWLWDNSINGGPLGAMGWVFPLLLGSLVADLYPRRVRTVVATTLGWGVGLGVAGWALSFLWPFSQRMMSCSYAVASTGLCFLTVLFFYLIADVWKRPLPHLSTLGKNALTIYIAQQFLVSVWHGHFPEDTGLWAALAGFTAIYGGCYALAAFLDRKGYSLRF